MVNLTTLHQELFDVVDGENGIVYAGFDQEWYPSKFKRMAGCGPTAAAHVVFYLTQWKQKETTIPQPTKVDAVAVMNDLWKYVTPSFGGVNTTKKLYGGILKYATDAGLSLVYEVCDVPKKKSMRPSFSDVVSFIQRGIAGNLPVSFLNLSRGTLANLEDWHWVSIIAIDVSEDSHEFIVVLDGGKKKELDLKLWLETTKLGGGFVLFREREQEENQ